MIVLTMPAQPNQARRPAAGAVAAMAWVTWRQHRPTLISLPAVLGAVAMFLWIAA